MKRTILSILIGSVLTLATGWAIAGGQQADATPPTPAEIQQQAMKDGPSTGRVGYLTQKNEPASYRQSAPIDPKLLEPLSAREVGMLYNACIAYPECKTAYASAREHEQALQRARQASADQDK